jgi:hypothetical protein
MKKKRKYTKKISAAKRSRINSANATPDWKAFQNCRVGVQEHDEIMAAIGSPND